MIEFFATGIPKGQPRPRAFAFRGRARVFDPGTAENWKSCVAEAAREHSLESPLEGALAVHIDFFFPRPKSHFAKAGLKDAAPRWHTGKPDADNAAKAVLDALTLLGFWRDDSQVSELICRKYYAHSSPGARITIRPATLI